MAQPPPSGPSQPPYQPYPQQPYPPQYPPQQPYYAPAAPPPREDRTLLYVVVAIIVVIAVIAVASLYFFFLAVNTATQFSQIKITGASFTITYNGATTGYFGNQITACPSCPMTVSLYTQFTFPVTLTNNGAFSHSVDSIALSGSSFQLQSVSPTLPYAVTGGSTTTFTLTIQPSTIAGSYTLAGSVGTT